MWSDFVSYCNRSDVQRVLEHPIVQRLADIGHYGLLPDYFPNIQPAVANTTRFDHTLGVAYLAFAEAGRRGLEDVSRDALIFAAVFHDIAHTALSHSLEPVFVHEDAWDHNIEAPSLARGIMKNIGFPAQLSGVIEGILGRVDPLSTLLFGQLGVDSLENIHRAFLLRSSKNTVFSAGSRQEKVGWSPNSAAEINSLLQTKTELYAEFFYHPGYQLFERVAQALVLSRLPDLYQQARATYVAYPRPLHLVDDDVRSRIQGDLADARRIVCEIYLYSADDLARHSLPEGVTWYEFSARRRDIQFVAGEVIDRKWRIPYRFSSDAFADAFGALPALDHFISRVS
jgi:HD superfamily phosphohydrolase